MKTIIILILLNIVGLFPINAIDIKLNSEFHSEKWVEQHFRKGVIPPFSFVYGGCSSNDFIKVWKFELKKLQRTKTNVTSYEAIYSDPKNKLRVICEINAFTDFPSVEWVIKFNNISEFESKNVHDVHVMDLSFKDAQSSSFILHSLEGSHASKTDFHHRSVELQVSNIYHQEPEGGRSSQIAFPFFNLESKNRCGVIISIGWSGTWFVNMNKLSLDKVCFNTGLSNADFFLYPKECVRLSRVNLLFWQGDNFIIGQNRFRQFILEHHSHKVNGKLLQPPMSSSFNYGDPQPCNEYTCLTDDYAIALIRRYKQFGILPEVFWLDAGWYADAGNIAEHKDWANTVGNWVVDSLRFPKGLRPISDEAHKVGAKFMVWFEPERVMKTSIWGKQHPEYMIDGGDNTYLLNLGDPNACAWLSKKIGDFIEENGIDYYRQDFNTEPDKFWRLNDKPGRKGILEMKYIEGLYRYWDSLIARFPNMLIDNCASGGRRIDLETISRSVPLWRTDYCYGEPIGYQCHTYGLNMFLPMHAIGTHQTDRFTFRSSLGTGIIYNWKITSADFSFYEMQACIKEFQDVRPYFYENYYPLTAYEDMTRNDIWLAYQLHRSKDGSGYIVAFRRQDNLQPQIIVQMNEINRDKKYKIYDYDKKETFIVSGNDLKNGYALQLKASHSSLLLKYEEIS